MLKQELSKLREDDIKKVKERNKRLDSIKKVNLLNKHESSSNTIKAAKLENEIMIKKIIDNDVKDLRNKNHLDKALISLTKSLDTGEMRNKILANNNLKISINESLYKTIPVDEAS